MKKSNSPVEKTRQKIAKEETKLADLNAKRDELNASIKECEAEIVRLRNQEKTEMLADSASLLADKGISVNDLLAAIQSGDFLTLQERFESFGSTDAASAPAADTYSTTAENPDELV